MPYTHTQLATLGLLLILTQFWAFTPAYAVDEIKLNTPLGQIVGERGPGFSVFRGTWLLCRTRNNHVCVCACVVDVLFIICDYKRNINVHLGSTNLCGKKTCNGNCERVFLWIF